jgi:hypothetical protein
LGYPHDYGNLHGSQVEINSRLRLLTADLKGEIMSVGALSRAAKMLGFPNWTWNMGHVNRFYRDLMGI